MTRALTVMALLMTAVIGATLLMRRAVTPADIMRSYARDAVEHAQRDFRVTLDYSEASLDALETIAAAQRESFARHKPAEEHLQATSKMWGAYFGEVIRRQHGGEWTPSFALKTKGLQIEPPSTVRKRLVDGGNLTQTYEALLRTWSEN